MRIRRGRARPSGRSFPLRRRSRRCHLRSLVAVAGEQPLVVGDVGGQRGPVAQQQRRGTAAAAHAARAPRGKPSAASTAPARSVPRSMSRTPRPPASPTGDTPVLWPNKNGSTTFAVTCQARRRCPGPAAAPPARRVAKLRKTGNAAAIHEPMYGTNRRTAVRKPQRNQYGTPTTSRAHRTTGRTPRSRTAA